MTPKFKIGDIIVLRDSLKHKKEIIDITKDFEKWVEGDWLVNKKKRFVPENSYILKDLEKNKLILSDFSTVDDYYQLFQPVKEKSLKWKNYEEILV